MKITCSSPTAFRALALLGCGVALAVRLIDALSTTPAELARQAQARYLPQLLAVGGAPADPVQAYAALLIACFAAFAGALAWRTSARGAGSRWGGALLLAQVAVGAFVESDLLYLVAAELAFLMPHRPALRWLACVGACYVAATLPNLAHANAGVPHCNLAGVVPPSAHTMAALDWALELAFQAFAYAVGRFAASEWLGRQSLARALDDLAAANVLLDEAIRAAEQERIAGRVHGALARHARTLLEHLAAAQAQVSGRAVQAVSIAHEQASRLSIEVQRAAAAPALPPALDLGGALTALCEGVPSLKVSLACGADTARLGPALAHVVFRVVQEALSNCVRHAAATDMHIRLACSGDMLALSIADNGSGQGATQRTSREGQGLRGMRERVEAQGGRFQAGGREAVGFGISVWLPLPQEART